MKVPASPSNQCMFCGRRNNGNLLRCMLPSNYKHFWGLEEVQKKWGITDMKRLKAERSREGALHSLSSADRLLETRRFSFLRTLQAQLWGYWDFWCPYQYRLEWQALTFRKTHSNPEAALQPSSKDPQQSWEAPQHHWTCSQVTDIFLLVCISTGIIYVSCWLPAPAFITNCVSAMGLPVGSGGKACSLAASHPTFYPQAAGAFVNTRARWSWASVVWLRVCTGSLFLWPFVWIIQTVLNKTKPFFFFFT